MFSQKQTLRQALGSMYRERVGITSESVGMWYREGKVARRGGAGKPAATVGNGS